MEDSASNMKKGCPIWIGQGITMKFLNNKILEFFYKVLSFIFSIDTLITLLFLSGIAIVLYTVYGISIVAFGFSLGAALIIISFILLSANSSPPQK